MSFCTLLFVPNVQSQDVTVGLIERSEFASEIYTLIAPTGSEIAYIVNKCGHLVHQWNFPNKGAFGTYLREDGMLVRVESAGSTFVAGGSASRLSMYDWYSNMIWSQSFTEEDQFSIHHDIALLPNGNILALLWEKISKEDAIIAGRDENSVSDAGIWAEMIYEIKPINTDQSEIVWQWHSMDHLVQDINPNGINFGVVKDRPGNFDINYETNDEPDYFHFNGIDYHPGLDLILVSCRNFSEVYIFDHSTTTSEAIGSVGGNLGHGGDILYRTGNPEVYQHGLAESRVFYGQHDPRWLMEDGEMDLTFSVYNNGSERPEGSYSTVEEFLPSFDASTGLFERDSNLGFINDRQEVIIDGSQFLSFYSSRMSGAYKLKNSNYMVCHASSGVIIEVDSDLVTHWMYVNPVSVLGISTQGGLPGPNSVFKVQSLESSFPGFEGRDLIGYEPLELEPVHYECIASSTVDEQIHELKYNSVWNEDFFLESSIPFNKILIFTLQGQVVASQYLEKQESKTQISVSHLPKGMYGVRVNNQTIKCIKH